VRSYTTHIPCKCGITRDQVELFGDEERGDHVVAQPRRAIAQPRRAVARLDWGQFRLVLGLSRSCGLGRMVARVKMQLRPRATRPTVSSHGGAAQMRRSREGALRGARWRGVDREHPEWDFGIVRLRDGVVRVRALDRGLYEWILRLVRQHGLERAAMRLLCF
ncbi:hypothetical protein PIB30_107074, partial [Stylosanthes scabra]|nr:hypothetical protein [Stylosanthes scabra]